MKNFNQCAAQGDLFIRKIESLPASLTKINPVNGRYIVAHSETGHHHVIGADHEVKLYADPGNDMLSYLVVKKIIGTMLEHLHSFDTHESLQIMPGLYEIRRQREYVPEKDILGG